MKKIKLFTIGFTKKTAEELFNILSESGVRRIIDVRLNNNSQLAGYAKQKDLQYFLKAINDIDYIYIPELVPAKEMLSQYREDKNWDTYEKTFLDLLEERYKQADIKNIIMHEIKADDCLLCAEEKPDKCHRRLAAEFIKLKKKILRLFICEFLYMTAVAFIRLYRKATKRYFGGRDE